MSIDVVLPELGEPTAQATVSRWLKSVGDYVTAGSPLLEVSTDKVDIEIPAPATGVLIKQRAIEDDLVKVGDVLAVISVPDPIPAVSPVNGLPHDVLSAPTMIEVPDTATSISTMASVSADDTTIPPDTVMEEAAPPTDSDSEDTHVIPVGIPMFATPPAPRLQPTPPPQPSAPPQLAYATPGLRQLADALDVDLASIQGSGVGGRIRKQDVQAAADAQAAVRQWQDGLPDDHGVKQATTRWTTPAGDTVWLTVSYDPEAVSDATAIFDDLSVRLAR